MALVKEPIRMADRAEVYARDGGCMAPLVDPGAGPCRDQAGRVVDRASRRARTIDHVPRESGSPRRSVPRWMVQLCWGHHLRSEAGAVWATSHRDEERRYLAEKYGA